MIPPPSSPFSSSHGISTLIFLSGRLVLETLVFHFLSEQRPLFADIYAMYVN